MLQDITKSNAAPTEKTAVALGVFDGIHRGHQDVINCAISFSEKGFSPAVFTFNTKTVTTKGNGRLDMLISDDLKLEKLGEMGVQYVYSPEFSELKELTAENFVKRILVEKMHAAVAVCGENFRFGKGAFAGCSELAAINQKYGIETVVVPFRFFNGQPISSSEIRHLITSGSVDIANAMLGYDFQFRLPVVHGNALGRTISFPTINQYFPVGQVVPRFGVYASSAIIDGKELYSVTNIGIKPTIGGEKTPLAETHIIDYDSDLYGQEVTVLLKKFLRPETKFSGVAELKEQLDKDLAKAKEILYFDQSKGGFYYE